MEVETAGHSSSDWAHDQLLSESGEGALGAASARPAPTSVKPCRQGRPSVPGDPDSIILQMNSHSTARTMIGNGVAPSDRGEERRSDTVRHSHIQSQIISYSQDQSQLARLTFPRIELLTLPRTGSTMDQ